MFSAYERSFTSQNGEDGILEEIFVRIGTLPQPYIVEIACGDGSECNGRHFVEHYGFRGLFIDGRGHSAMPEIIDVKGEFVTRENVNQILDKYDVPKEIDLLSIDIDGNDYYLWEAINRNARVVVVEYNANIPPNQEFIIDYDPKFQWQGDEYQGASLLSLSKLAETKGYQLVYCEKNGINAFFVRNDLVASLFSILRIYRPANYGGLGLRHRRSPKLDHIDRRTNSSDPEPAKKV